MMNRYKGFMLYDASIIYILHYGEITLRGCEMNDDLN